ncbi:MAG: glycerol-3-phosphate acyltransferase PlsY [Pelagibacterales bacterium]|nr:glycerol-3-phosphate acyltransferase PlsY [Pelagibacterales bacterium]
MEYILVIFLSYLSGTIPFGLIITMLFTNKDIRKIGSGNIGATNVLRAGNKYLALGTLMLDSLKGFVPIVVTRQYFPELIELSSISVFLGHIFPIWLKFKGGKGVATYLGVITALSTQLCILFIITWIIVSLIFKYSSVSSMFASLTVFVVNFLRETVISADISLTTLMQLPDSKILFIFFILIIYTHKKNILNIKNKTENKIKI